jgi:hypothetical protein
MLPSIILQQMQGIIQERQAPTPYARGEILAISNYNQSLGTTGFTKMRATLVTTFRSVDYSPLSGNNTITGTTQLLDSPRLVGWRAKDFNTISEFSPGQIEVCSKYENFDMFIDVADSADLGWANFNENLAIYGHTADQIPGMLNGSGIPQTIDLNNFYNGSLNGSQMVDILLEYASLTKRQTGYTYSPEVMAIPSKLWLQLNKVTFAIAGSTTRESALTVLEDRLRKVNPNYRIVESPTQDNAKFIAFLPFDPDLIGLGVVDLKQYIRYGGEKIEHAGTALGVVAQQSSSGLIVKMAN